MYVGHSFFLSSIFIFFTLDLLVDLIAWGRIL